MINVSLTVKEAMYLASLTSATGNEVYDKIINAFEIALGVNQRRRVTITRNMNLDNRIPCIKAVRQHTGWGLKEAKDWTDGMVGRWDEYGKWRDGGREISLTAKTPEAAEQLLRDLTSLGCEGYLS